MKVDLTVLAVPAYFAAIGAEYAWQRAHPVAPGTPPDMSARRTGRTGSRARLRLGTPPQAPRGGAFAPRGSRLRLS